MSELRYFTWLSEAVPKGNIAVNLILERFNSAKKFYEALRSDSTAADFLAPNIKRGLLKTDISKADAILNRCEKSGIGAVCPADEDYPARLLTIDGIAPVLYYVGDISLLNKSATIGVVGTRKALDKSKQITGSICKALSECGIAVVSGCAVGIDEYAHRGAVKAKRRTVGVLGCGVDVNYPRKNARIKNKLLKLGGVLLSEQPPGTKALPANFPCRNRLLAGLSDSVFVVEAPERSGALITADFAAEQGKDVFCLTPLGFRDKRFSGCVKYLRSGAIPVYDVCDILFSYYMADAGRLDCERISELLEYQPPLPAIDGEREYSGKKAEKRAGVRKSNAGKTVKKPKQPDKKAEKTKRPVEGVSNEAQTLYNSALGFEPDAKRAGELAEFSGLSVGQVLSCLTELEIAGVVLQKPGGVYYIAEK